MKINNLLDFATSYVNYSRRWRYAKICFQGVNPRDEGNNLATSILEV